MDSNNIDMEKKLHLHCPDYCLLSLFPKQYNTDYRLSIYIILWSCLGVLKQGLET